MHIAPSSGVCVLPRVDRPGFAFRYSRPRLFFTSRFSAMRRGNFLNSRRSRARGIKHPASIFAFDNESFLFRRVFLDSEPGPPPYPSAEQAFAGKRYNLRTQKDWAQPGHGRAQSVGSNMEVINRPGLKPLVRSGQTDFSNAWSIE